VRPHEKHKFRREASSWSRQVKRALSDIMPILEAGSVRNPLRSSYKALLSKPAAFGSLIPIVTVLNAVVGMWLPKFMEPRLFGEYSLIVTLFSYGLIFDLGVSQVIDRRIPAYLGSAQGDMARKIGDRLLWVRLGVGVIALASVALVLTTLAIEERLPFSLIAGLLAALAGLADMIALGPVCIYRARSERRDYAVRIAILLSGLIFARVGGVVAGGLIGCFAALSFWYIGCAIWFHQYMPLKSGERPGFREAASLIAFGTPFFVTAFLWAFYVTGNRWFASFLIPDDQFGQFAFSANIFSLLVGAAGGFSAFYYPKMAERIANTHAYAVSSMLNADLRALLIITFCVTGVGITLAGFLIHMIYPLYADGIGTARIILIAVPPMVLASWLMPVSQSAGKWPLVDGLLIYPLATGILGCAIFVLYSHFGEAGAAWASTVSALPLVGMQLLVLCHAKILRVCHAISLFGISLGGCVALGLLVTEISSWTA
jgi:O-antigen/teichoic acid export membrane protein